MAFPTLHKDFSLQTFQNLTPVTRHKKVNSLINVSYCMSFIKQVIFQMDYWWIKKCGS